MQNQTLEEILYPDSARVLQIFLSKGHDYWGKQGRGRLQNGIESVSEVECIQGKGLRGDRYFAFRKDFKGQVTLFQSEVVQAVRECFNLPHLPASVFRGNLIVSGVPPKSFSGKTFCSSGSRV